jgi:tetratricopeptide (TPR) repeat protein
MLHTLFQQIGIEYSRGRFNEVESAARAILTTVPDDFASLQLLALAYYRSGRKVEALEILNADSQENDQTLQADAEAGEDFLSRNGYSAAAACQLAATRQSPELALAWYDLGMIWTELGRSDRALRAFRSALAACPAHLSTLPDFGPFMSLGEPSACAADRRSPALDEDE